MLDLFDVLAPQELKDTFQQKGFALIPRILREDALKLLRDECAMLQADAVETGRDLIDEDCTLEVWKDDLPATGRSCVDAYFERRLGLSADMRQILTMSLASLARVALGGMPPLLFNEHYVVKVPGAGPFIWHTDAAHQLEGMIALGIDTTSSSFEYVSIWIALDDVNHSNGCLRLLPLNAPQPPGAWSEPAGPTTVDWFEGQGKVRGWGCRSDSVSSI